MSQNNESNTAHIVIGAAVVLVLLPVIYIVNHTGASFEIVFKSFISTIISIVVFTVWFSNGYAVFGSPKSSLLFLAINWLSWMNVFKSAAQSITPPSDDVFGKITQQIPWWSENWFLWGVEIILIGAIGYFFWKDSQSPYY